MEKTEVVRIADHLNFYSTIFDYSDWEYSEDTGDLEHIRYTRDYTGYHVWWRRWKRAIRQLLRWRLPQWQKELGTGRPNWSWEMTKAIFNAWVRKDTHLPDCVLNGGGVIVHWGETGEFINLMSPDVGELLAQWMTAEPENEYAIRIAERMKGSVPDEDIA